MGTLATFKPPRRIAVVVHDPPGDCSPRLEPDGDRAGLVSLELDQAHQLPPFMLDDHSARLRGVEATDLEARRFLVDFTPAPVGEPAHGRPADRFAIGVDGRDHERAAGVDLKVHGRRLGPVVDVDFGQGVVLGDRADVRP